MPLLVLCAIVFASLAIIDNDRHREHFVEQCHAQGRVPVFDKQKMYCFEVEHVLQSLKTEEKDG